MTPFRFGVRVYYEDTDAAGVVYYANYLKYMERARTEWLAALGFDVAALAREHAIAFAVHRLELEYLLPARLGDRLEVTVEPCARGRARLVLDQAICRAGDVLVRGHVALACVDPAAWRPARLPAFLAAALQQRGTA